MLLVPFGSHLDVKFFIETTSLHKNICTWEKLILVMFKCMVSMTTHNAILLNGGVPTKTTTSQLLLSLDY